MTVDRSHCLTREYSSRIIFFGEMRVMLVKKRLSASVTGLFHHYNLQ